MVRFSSVDWQGCCSQSVIVDQSGFIIVVELYMVVMALDLRVWLRGWLRMIHHHMLLPLLLLWLLGSIMGHGRHEQAFFDTSLEDSSVLVIQSPQSLLVIMICGW